MNKASLFTTALAIAALAAAAPVVNVEKLHPIAPGQVTLLPGEFLSRANLNREYVHSLKNENLLQNYYLEAGLWSPRYRMTAMGEKERGDEIHWGWESPTCQLRGHFLGHWLSAAAFHAASAGDAELNAKANRIVSELARVQKENGGQWAASIPEKYLFWITKGKSVWAPHYTIHKTFMGLVDMHKLTGSREALDVAEKFAGWFHEWTRGFTREQMDEILEVETGGMLEVWADLYGITGQKMYLDLMDKYRRGRLFDRLLAGKDALTNRHANTTVPEAQGAARAYEVTGDEGWRKVVDAYWKSAVTDRGYYATGGQTSGEIWTPPNTLAARLGDKNQEHCVVYNMIRLADYLFRWTGNVTYADYIERNIYNGILAQQHPQTGMIAYFLPLEPGAKKVWGSRTSDFWCCHGSLVQAHSRHDRYIYYRNDGGLLVAQYIPSEVTWEHEGNPIRLSQTFKLETDAYGSPARPNDPDSRPNRWVVEFRVAASKPTDFALQFRLPWWLQGEATISVNGQVQKMDSKPSSFTSVRRSWGKDTVRLLLPKGLHTAPLPDEPSTVAFLDGPTVLAGLCDNERTLYGEKNKPETMLAPDNEREWSRWLPGYRTINQNVGLRFVPLSAITEERYTVYFPVRQGAAASATEK